MTDTKPLLLWNATQDDLGVLRTVKESLTVPFLVKPVPATLGLAGRVLAYGTRPSYPCDYRLVGEHCSVQEGFEWATHLRELPDVPYARTPSDPLFWDLETHSVEAMWDMEPREFFRLGQYAWGDGPVTVTTDYDEMLSIIREAPLVIGHHISPFDLTVLFGKHSTEPLQMALDGKVWDTKVHANLVYPAPEKYTDRHGHTFYDAAKPERAKRFLSLDNLSFQLGLTGKIGDLKMLAKRHGGFGQIPTDDPEFLEYAVQDVVAVRDLYCALNQIHHNIGYSDEYAAREQVSAAVDAQNSRNGFTVDVAVATKRRDDLAARRKIVLDQIVEKYSLPTEGKSPWASNAGKTAIFAALADYGITPDNSKNWPKTAKGNPTLGGQALIDLTVGTDAEELGQALAELKGQRSLAQLAIDCTRSDGKAHPEITALQRSGRKSFSRPALSIWSARGDKASEKAYFVAPEGFRLVEMDYSQADARAVAAMSGDRAYAERFAPGADAHDITGELFFGKERFDAERYELRQVAKAANHSMAYRVGSKKLATTTGITVAESTEFLRLYKEAYPDVAKWQDRVTAQGGKGFVTNAWGRRMPVDPDRSFTQSSALLGQSTTREVLVDGLIRIARTNLEVLTWLSATIHDAVVWCIPEAELGWAVDFIRENMEAVFEPKGGQAIEFSMSAGDPARDWQSAGH